MKTHQWTERALKGLVIECAMRGGWLIHHDLPSQRARGAWTTHTQGHSGFPDLVLAHPGDVVNGLMGQCLFVELKTERGVVSKAQQDWLDTLAAAGMSVRIWRPENYVEIRSRLLEWQKWAPTFDGATE